jgi:HK97 family phage prohead protease
MKVVKDASLETTVKDDAARRIAFVLSTEAVDRDGDTISPKGWDLAPYRKNPIILWHHDTSILPIAKSEEIDVVDGKLKAVAVFPKKGVHAFADTVYELVKGGFVNAASVGFNGIDREPREGKGYHYKKQELYEWSILPVPSHREALREAEKSGIDLGPVRKWANDFLTSHSDDVVTKAWAEAVPAVLPHSGATTGSGDHATAGAAGLVGKYIREHEGKQCVFSRDGKKLGCHDTIEEAQAHLAAIEANKRSPEQVQALVKGWLSTQPVITPEMLEAACPKCAAALRSKGIKSFLLKPGYSLVDFLKGFFAEVPAEFADVFGDAKHFDMKCNASPLGDVLDDVSAFCADLKGYVHPEFRIDLKGGLSAREQAELYGPGGRKVTGVVSIGEVLDAYKKENDKNSDMWLLQDALQIALASIERFAKDGEKRELRTQAASDFASRFEAAKSADSWTTFADEVFGTKAGDPPQQPPPQQGAQQQPPPQQGQQDAGSGNPAIDAAYKKLWDDVKAAIQQQDPQQKANALKQALEAFAQVVMEGGQPQQQQPQQQQPLQQGQPQGMGVSELLEKVGRVLSGKNEARLRAALASLGEIITSLPQAPEEVAFVDGDSTTPDRNGGDGNGKGMTDEDWQALGSAYRIDKPPKKPKEDDDENPDEDEMDKLLRAELNTTKADLKDGIRAAVRDGMTQARTAAFDGRLPD